MTTELVIPIGFRFDYKINKSLSVNLDASIRNVNTDKLDAYVDYHSAKDKYEYIAIGLTYKFDLVKRSISLL